MKKELPKNYDHTEIESRWSKAWNDSKIFKWDAAKPREQTFIVDTPPPTVSGSLHVGHVFSYTHTDIITRFQRMQGKNIMYPMGWDDNGLPTERRVQNKFNITCDPNLPYDPNWNATPHEGERQLAVSRRNFIEACAKVTHEDERAFEELWRHLSLSVEWEEQYATINDHCRVISQLSFLDLVKKGLVLNSESPTMWDVTFQTALAQADIEDRNQKGAYYDVVVQVEGFQPGEGGGEFVISTTRPELLAACIAIVFNPNDDRYKKFDGKTAIVPLFGYRVPIRTSEHAEIEKGTGIMQISTFGDVADATWWKGSGLPLKGIVGKDGRLKEIDFTADPFKSVDPERAARIYDRMKGKRCHQARTELAKIFAEEKIPGTDRLVLVGEPKPIEHPVKFYEKGDLPIEFITTRQWFIRILDFKTELRAQADKINWFPEHMKHRYTNWVDGLAHDWCISRQRFFGVPFPVWYNIDANGEIDYDKPIFPDSKQLPVDPYTDLPQGFTEEQRGKPGGFIGDPDVMDTWATSSLTPQIVSKWGLDGERHKKLFPMDIRPQSHEIIRTWAFYTIAKAWMHEREIPWRNVIISGWILDPDRKKMSKSKGNTITPGHLLQQYSADAVRYWAGRARLGVDTAFDEKVFQSGRKVATKLFNAAKFLIAMLHQLPDGSQLNRTEITAELDRSWLEWLADTVARATKSFNEFEYAAALQATEDSFWRFCDCYIELVKARAYEEVGTTNRSGLAALELSLSAYLRLFAPFMPYITEEIWSWHFAGPESSQFIHTAKWPCADEFAKLRGEHGADSFDAAAKILSAVHSKKSEAQKTLKWPVERLDVAAPEGIHHAIQSVLLDVSKAARVDIRNIQVGVLGGAEKELRVEIQLSETFEDEKRT